MTKKKAFPLCYNEIIDRWMIDDYGLHCGDCFSIKIYGKWEPVRIEMTRAGEWYLDYDDYMIFGFNGRLATFD